MGLSWLGRAGVAVVQANRGMNMMVLVAYKWGMDQITVAEVEARRSTRAAEKAFFATTMEILVSSNIRQASAVSLLRDALEFEEALGGEETLSFGFSSCPFVVLRAPSWICASFWIKFRFHRARVRFALIHSGSCILTTGSGMEDCDHPAETAPLTQAGRGFPAWVRVLLTRLRRQRRPRWGEIQRLHATGSRRDMLKAMVGGKLAMILFGFISVPTAWGFVAFYAQPRN